MLKGKMSEEKLIKELQNDKESLIKRIISWSDKSHEYLMKDEMQKFHYAVGMISAFANSLDILQSNLEEASK